MTDSTVGARDLCEPARSSPRFCALTLIAIAHCLLLSCNGAGGRTVPEAREIATSDFSNPGAATSAASAGNSESADLTIASAPTRDEAVHSDSSSPATAASESVAAAPSNQTDRSPMNEPDAPVAMSLAPLRPGEPYVIDRLIGQINGRPIFADEFFAPIEDRLIASRKTMNTAEFVQEVEAVVDRRLQEVALNELFISEAQAALTPEEQRGLSRWQRAVREILLAKSSGIEGEAEQRAQEEGLSLDQRLMAIKDEALVRRLIDQKITPRVIVSWRDIEREYRRRSQEFNPPGQIHFTRIAVATEGNEELISEIGRRLATESFQDVAKSLSPSLVSEWGPFTMREGKIDNLPLVDESLKAELADLATDETKGPLPVGRYTWWLHVSSIEQSAARTVFDPQVQRSLYLDLTRQRQIEEQNRYIDSLFQKGVYDDMDMMRFRLRRVALLRYGR